jgi:hypothetical protein
MKGAYILVFIRNGARNEEKLQNFLTMRPVIGPGFGSAFAENR